MTSEPIVVLPEDLQPGGSARGATLALADWPTQGPPPRSRRCTCICPVTFGNAGPDPSRSVSVMTARPQDLISRVHEVPAEDHAAVYEAFESTLLE